MKDLSEILTIAREVGWGAASLLSSYYHGTAEEPNLDIKYKDNEPVTLADLAVSQYILTKLQAALGNEEFGYISEETYKSQHGQNSHEWVWIIDPLDGTRDFITKTGEYAIHIALVQGTRPVLAVVVIPETKKLYYATKGGGTFVESVNGSYPLKVTANKPIEDLTLVVSRSHRNEALEYLLQNLPCQNQKAIGSVGCKITAIVEQQADIYISLSGKSAPKDWDMAAPELILTEAGGKFTHFNGQPLEYNTGDINQWGGLLASNSQHHEILCQKAEQTLTKFASQDGDYTVKG
ncbi:3'(2'),5'-bisphosphate nucleotidase CysQ [Anabaena cylindrica FACHB-243]|nr:MULTISPECIES: 3'(2'),5'-bisphosphate nucleotidase CysQ [Anabaena]MBD2419770.1 3'(2'),5'-bisphosphate nucleotidase CysQ [Anabaena cylindrica FACHB-243]MBY5281526.1 3'(2'),5'-bisphosphate nucleotidase CysQ [Anabaena sp. CCAP 1446/1C]MBY5307220.1 3'(2'),5'-bisphosphate nucleotidase CysQ [Anabaena sp. CCAP 1446/1C]MCM2405584.1 3'(2'),5'-bisphosphate nucleotidase CysQ [Anabaena sp. CCAP 1446/1C]